MREFLKERFPNLPRWVGWVLVGWGVFYTLIDFLGNVDFFVSNYNKVPWDKIGYFLLNPPGWVQVLVLIIGLIWLKIVPQPRAANEQRIIITNYGESTNNLSNPTPPVSTSKIFPDLSIKAEKGTNKIIIYYENFSTKPIYDIDVRLTALQNWSISSKEFLTYSFLPQDLLLHKLKVIEPEAIECEDLFICKEDSLMIKTLQAALPNLQYKLKANEGLYRAEIRTKTPIGERKTEIFVNWEKSELTLMKDPRLETSVESVRSP